MVVQHSRWLVHMLVVYEKSENALQDIGFDDKTYCARLDGNEIKDMQCSSHYGTLCQYDCDNPPSVTSENITCQRAEYAFHTTVLPLLHR